MSTIEKRQQYKRAISLRYPILLTPISEEEGGGWCSEILQLGSYAFVGDGETIEKALSSLENIKRTLFRKYLDEDINFPLGVK